MPDTMIDVQSQLNQLRQDFLDRLPNRLEEIETQCQQLSAQWNAEALGTVHRLVHSLRGTSATFGLTTLSHTARLLEQQLLAWTEQPSKTDWEQATALLLQLRQQLNPKEVILPAQQIEPEVELQRSQGNHRLVFLVEEDTHAAAELALQISYFGYEVQTFNQIHQLQQALIQTMPATIIISLAEIDLQRNAAEFAKLNQCRISVQAKFSVLPPIIFISMRDDHTERLEAVRAGGNAYFTQPTNIHELIDKLDQLIEHCQLDPYRVLIVEDDRELAEFHALTLQKAGMMTQVVTNPVRILQPLNEFKPDLILMDVYMPFCSGLELAAVIRQQVEYVSIPIVFLSTETDLNKQLTAMSLGGDDFLTKPIQPQHLISSVASRAQRSTTLRSYMVRDSLTGLFNHTKLKEQLAIELKRAHRQNSSLAFAMIDIDHFKRVNDIYGHPTGDRVIKSLSRLLQQRLRQTDVIGRYGGEEFAVILVDTDTSEAVQVLNRIRQSFAQVQQRTEETEFNVTFSCGIALSSIYPTASEISKAADKALYEAKQAGRNQVIVSTVKADF